jgi:hypothetical protein
MKKILFILGMVIGCPSFVLMLMDEGGFLELSTTQETILIIVFFASLPLIYKFKPKWMKD